MCLALHNDYGGKREGDALWAFKTIRAYLGVCRLLPPSVVISQRTCPGQSSRYTAAVTVMEMSREGSMLCPQHLCYPGSCCPPFGLLTSIAIILSYCTLGKQRTRVRPEDPDSRDTRKISTLFCSTGFSV